MAIGDRAANVHLPFSHWILGHCMITGCGRGMQKLLGHQVVPDYPDSAVQEEACRMEVPAMTVSAANADLGLAEKAS